MLVLLSDTPMQDGTTLSGEDNVFRRVQVLSTEENESGGRAKNGMFQLQWYLG